MFGSVRPSSRAKGLDYTAFSGLTREAEYQREQSGMAVKYRPTVSVVMPAYNAAKTIRQSIDSVVAQTYLDWELLVIADASNDETVKIIKDIAGKDSWVRLYSNERKTSVAHARNIGIAYAQGEWIAFLDSDDCWHKDKLEKQIRFNEKTGAAISYTGTSYINEAGVTSSYVLHAEREFSYSELLKRNIMSCSSIIVRRDIIKEEPFSEGELSEDYAAWMRILRKTGCSYGLDEPLLIYRMARRSKSSSRLQAAKNTFNAYRYAGYSFLLSFLLTVRYSWHSISKRLLIRMGRM